MSLEQLNTQYGIDGQLQVVSGKGDFPYLEIRNAHATALISVYGGQLLSFQPLNEPEDLLFVSENAYFQSGKAIKGGTPICWPWFGSDPEGLGRPSHGFVRNRLWRVLGTQARPDGSTVVRLGLSDTEETRSIWPHAFQLTLEISVGASLSLTLSTQNTGQQPFFLTQALHTYFQVGNIQQVQVLGLDNHAYFDKVAGGVKRHQSGEVAIAEEVDRIYTQVEDAVVIHDPTFGRRIRIRSGGSRTAVVWNPWAKLAAQSADLADQDYQHFVCVETANAASDVVQVAPHATYCLTATYQVERS